MNAAATLHRFLFTGCSPERLAATRWILGFGFIPFFVMQYGAMFGVEPFGRSWYYTDPVWYFDALGIHWHIPWMAMCGVLVLTAALVSFALGFRTRAAAFTILVLILLLKGARDSVAGDVHHREIIPFHVLLFFAFSRCGDVFSLDARRRLHAPPVSTWEASWPVKASQLYVASFYLWGGLAKLRASGTAWLASGGGLQELMVSRAVRFDGEPEGSSIGFWLAQYPSVLALLAVGVVAMELGFPLLLLLKGTLARAVFLGVVTFFHVANYILMSVKFLLLPVVFVLFFDPAPAVRRWLPKPG